MYADAWPVVVDTTKVDIFKQITTSPAVFAPVV